MPVQAPQWSEYLSCPVCQNEFEVVKKPPVSLACGHTVCRTCLESLQRRQCPFDQTTISVDLAGLPVNTALLQLIGSGEVPARYRVIPPELQPEEVDSYSLSLRCVEELAMQLKPSVSSALSRPMQRKLVTLLNCQLLEEEGRARAARAARSLGERSVTELILQHQNPQQLSANLWAAVRARGCQFLGPAMQEEVLKLVLLALEDGSALSRKVLVMFVVQRLEPCFPQASKTSIGHVVQLLYRASCFKVTKRDGDSSLMQLKEEFRTYDSLRREHDTQIVQIATEGGLRIAPDQWSSLLYGDSAHKSHMQSIMDKLQSPQSFGQSVQELVIALQRTGDPGGLAALRSQLDCLTSIDPSPESETPSWSQVTGSLLAAKAVVTGLVNFCSLMGHRRSGDGMTGHVARYKTSLCRDLATHGSCPRGQNCTFAHSQAELEMHRSGAKKTKSRDLGMREVGGGVRDGDSGGRQEERSIRETKNRTEDSSSCLPLPRDSKLVANLGPPPVAQVAPIPRVLQMQVHQPMEPIQHQQLTPIVDANGTPMLDAATGHPLVAAPVQQQQLQYLAGADGGLYTVQPGTQLQIMAQVPTVLTQQQPPPPHPQQQQQHPQQQTSHQQQQPQSLHPGQQQSSQQESQQQQQLVQQQQVQQQQVQQQQVQQQQAQQQLQQMLAHSGGNPQVVIQSSQPLATTQTQPSATMQSQGQGHSEMQRREIKHDLSPDIASKSLSALKDRKEEILSELGDIVGTTAASAIGNMASQQAATGEKMSLESGESSESENRQNCVKGGQNEPANGTYGIWTTKPLVTMSMLTAMAGSRHAMQNKEQELDPFIFRSVEVEPLPEGICVSRFGPISRKHASYKNYSEPTAVTAGFGLHTRSTTSLRQPLPVTSPVPENLLVVQDHHSVLQFPDTASVYEFDPGYYTDYVHSNIQEGMESVSMSHLVNPPYTPISPLPDPRDQTASSVRLNSQSLTMAAESARIQKELSDLQRRISCLSVAENSNQMAMKRDRLAIELSRGRPASDNEQDLKTDRYPRMLATCCVRSQSVCLLTRLGHLEPGAQAAALRRNQAIIRMIESGIRERHQEITQNLTYPHSESGDEINTEYTYW